MNVFTKTEILYSLISEKQADLDVLRTLREAGVSTNYEKLEQQIEAQLQLLKTLDLNAEV